MNYFQLWMEYMGFNLKQVGKAGADIGLNSRYTASSRFNGNSEVTDTERLAMSARAAGLKPWSPRYHSQLEAIKSIGVLLDEKAAHQRKAPTA